MAAYGEIPMAAVISLTGKGPVARRRPRIAGVT